MVSVEKFQETGLSACRAFHTAKPKVLPGSLKVPQVHEEVLDPDTRSLAHSGQLGRSKNAIN